MNKLFTDEAWKDYLYWYEHDRRQLKRIHELIREINRSPFEGIGKPEPLKYDLKGCWSRRIDQEHRLVYKVDDHNIYFILMRFHYVK